MSNKQLLGLVFFLILVWLDVRKKLALALGGVGAPEPVQAPALSGGGELALPSPLPVSWDTVERERPQPIAIAAIAGAQVVYVGDTNYRSQIMGMLLYNPGGAQDITFQINGVTALSLPAFPIGVGVVLPPHAPWIELNKGERLEATVSGPTAVTGVLIYRLIMG